MQKQTKMRTVAKILKWKSNLPQKFHKLQEINIDSKTARNDQNLTKNTRNEQKSKQSYQKLPEITKILPKKLNWQKYLKIIKNYQKLPKIAKNYQKSPKSTKITQNHQKVPKGTKISYQKFHKVLGILQPNWYSHHPNLIPTIWW